MASITSLTGSTTSTTSIYGNSNVISGLASGLDTESMIENAVSGIKDKITSLNKDLTMLEWEQTAYRSIIDKLSDFSSKYLSYTSNTNLLSTTFFNNATKVTTTGAHAGLVSATGQTKSDFKILAATAATAASYSGIGDSLKGTSVSTGKTMKDLGLAGGEIKLAGTEKSFTVSESDTLSSVLNKMKEELGIEATYSQFTGEFYLKSTETGSQNSFALEGALAEQLFGANAAGTGTDATIKLSINGSAAPVTKTQASNTFDIDGMQVTLKGDIAETDEANAVGFTTDVDADKIISAVKSMIDDYNIVANEIKEAYSTKPELTSKKKRYEPLTEEEAKDLSETAIEKYEKKAKTGILFGDSDLFSLYDEMRSAINSIDLEAIGIKTEYDNGKTTLSLDESALRSALENNPEKVRDTLTKSTKDGASEDGALAKLQGTIDKYAKTTGTKGILVKLAGTEKSATAVNDNTYKSKMDRLQEQIERWEDKLSNKIDYYTKQFTALEKMISNMNSQSSALSGLMGY